MKYIVKVVKRLIMAFLILYGLNVMLSGVDFYIPINLVTVGSITLLGIPGILGLVAMFFII